MSRFAKYAWFISGYTILVILWGAIVRATGSGAGCGNHWPACNGEILHLPQTTEAIIEFGHRLTSGFAGILVIILLVWAFVAVFKYNHKFIRSMSVMTFIFIIIEGGLGAALVRFELVADNSSVARAIMIGLHLINTLILLGFSVLTAWAASKQERISFNGISKNGWLMVIGIIGFIALSAIGAITALGDTLFPVATLAEGLQQDLDSTAHFLIQLRVWHPILAIVLSIYLFYVGYQLLAQKNPSITRVVNMLFAAIIIQVLGGFLNVVLLAPIVMQIVHLLLADLLWIVIILLTAEVLAEPQEAVQSVADDDVVAAMA